MRDDFAGCELASDVALLTKAQWRLEAALSNRRQVRDEVIHALGAIVDDDEFTIGILLTEEELDGARHEMGTSRCRHDA